MRLLSGIAVFFTLALGPAWMTWHALNPTGFWQKIVFLALAVTPEFFLITLGAATALLIID